MSPPSLYVGVDVGTHSARAVLVTAGGAVRGRHSRPIAVHAPAPQRYQQDSGEIWAAVCCCVKAVLKNVGANEKVAGIGFDATCSLVVLDDMWQPLTVDSYTGESRWNIIMWMDHRATKETDMVNSKPRKVLDAVGGVMSAEMQVPKLLWLKKSIPETWHKAAHLFDLPDFLTAKATGNTNRSLCSLVCKWTYEHTHSAQGWDAEFFQDVGLGDLMENKDKIGGSVLSPGSLSGGVSPQAAAELGLAPGTPVAASLIDAHAGALGVLAATPLPSVEGTLAIVSGTSSCHLLLSPRPLRVGGVWGPYYEALLPCHWLAEAGQTATGALCDHIVNTHPVYGASEDMKGLIERLMDKLERLAAAEGMEDPCLLTRNLHIYPDFHGNRAPLADHTMRGMMCGLSMDAGVEDLALKYLATVQAIAYGCRDIVEALRAAGHRVERLLMCGGLAQSPLLTQTHADVLGVEVIVPSEPNLSVVMGAAILAIAATSGGGFAEAMANWAQETIGNEPRPAFAKYHDAKYAVYKKMQGDQRTYRQIMDEHFL